jgi:geranylgeranylglycerol-phosphate geranylgeranyltransferase
MHPLVGLSAAGVAYVGAVVAGSAFIAGHVVLWALLSVFLIAGGGMVAGDIVDATIDKTNNPKRPLPSGKITRGNAIAWSVLLLVVGNFIPFYFITLEAFYVAITATALFLAYHTVLKRIPLAGNVLVSILLVLAIFFGSFVQGNYNAALQLMVMIFLSSMAREIYKTIDHVLGEKHPVHMTMSTKLGVIKARMIGSLFIAATVIASFVPFFTNISSVVYLFFAVIADIIFVAAAISPLRLSSKLIKIAMLIIFLAFLADIYNVRYLVAG